MRLTVGAGNRVLRSVVEVMQMLGRLLRRNRPAPGPQTQPDASPSGTPLRLADFPGIEPQLDAGDLTAVMAAVDAADPGRDEVDRARIELQLRHEAFRRRATRPEPLGTWPPSSARQLDASGGLPEVTMAALDTDTLVAGVRNHGAIIVRGLLSPEVCADLRGRIDQALDNFTAPPEERDPKWHTPLCDVDGRPLSQKFRANGYVTFDGQVAVADTPGAAPFILDQFERAGVSKLVREYLDEPAALSLEKWTLRRVPPTTNSSWHQDGAFLGTDIHTINLWIALSECGETASGLDVIGKRFDHIVPTGTPGAYFDWDVAQDVVDRERGDSPVVSPVFQPGDAVFFDQFLLHRTGIKPDLTQDRYALESWFFTPTSYPSHYAGLLA